MQSFTMEVGGRALTIEHGKMAKQANGAVLVATAIPWCLSLRRLRRRRGKAWTSSR